jgi:hypothetical protein
VKETDKSRIVVAAELCDSSAKLGGSLADNARGIADSFRLLKDILLETAVSDDMVRAAIDAYESVYDGPECRPETWMRAALEAAMKERVAP